MENVTNKNNILKEYQMVLFSMQDSVIHARGMLRDVQKRDKNTSHRQLCFLRFPKVEQHAKCMDHAILHEKLVIVL